MVDCWAETSVSEWVGWSVDRLADHWAVMRAVVMVGLWAVRKADMRVAMTAV